MENTEEVRLLITNETLHINKHLTLVLVFCEGKGATGRNGDDQFVKVPIGTIVSEITHSNDEMDDIDGIKYENEIDEELLLFDEENEENADMAYLDDEGPRKAKASQKKEICLEKEKDIVLVAAGGQPGLGNQVLAGAKHQRQKSLVSCIVMVITTSSLILCVRNSLQQKYQVKWAKQGRFSWK